MLCETDVFASKAYSVGTKYASGVEHAGNDFTGLVATAANAYGWLSGYSSYYSYQPTYSYVKSSSRLGGSSVFFIAGHASSTSITLASKDSSNYRTGISAFNDGYTITDANGKTFTLAGLLSRDMSKTKLITFIGCNTGYKYQSTSVTLVNRAVKRGATAAVGFRDEIGNSTADTNWITKYNTLLGNGWSIQYAIDKASIYSPSNCSNYVTTDGDTSISLGTLDTSSLNLINEDILNNEDDEEYISTLNGEEIDFEDEYLNTTIEDEIYFTDFYNEDEDKLSELIDLIKEFDSTFDLKNYKTDFNLLNDDGYGYIYFTYYIDNVKTNKVYMIITENYKVKELWLAGITKDTYQTLCSFDDNLSDRIESFVNNEKAEFIEENNDFDLSEVSDISDTIEEYYFDYNENKLYYIYSQVLEYGDTGSSMESVSTIID